jgi:hypothetical protein
VHGQGCAACTERVGGQVKKAVNRCLVLVLLLTGRPPDRLIAQARDTARASQPVPATVRDTTHYVKPVGALWRSLLLPGWGQARTGRQVTGAAFVIWEGVTVMMTVRAVQEKHYLEETGSANLASKRQQIQDWAVLWGFNHLFAGAEAFVSAHLMDFPKELKLRAVPGGLGISVPLP